MDNIKLKLNSNSYIEILIDFDITEYVSGDIIIKYFSDDVEVFSRDTQLKYFVDLLMTTVDGLLDKKNVLEYNGDNIVMDYMQLLNGKSGRNDVNAKAFIDFSVADGYVAFMYWNISDNFIEVAKVSKNSAVWDKKIKMDLQMLMTWKSQLNELSMKIGKHVK